MEAHGESQPDASCSSFSQDGSGVSVSRELLTAGSGGRGGDGRVAAAWGAHVRQGSRCRSSRGPVGGSLPRPGPTEGPPGWPQDSVWDRAAGGAHPASGLGVVPVSCTAVSAH